MTGSALKSSRRRGGAVGRSVGVDMVVDMVVVLEMGELGTRAGPVTDVIKVAEVMPAKMREDKATARMRELMERIVAGVRGVDGGTESGGGI